MNILHLNPELNITCGVSKTIYYLCHELNSDAHHFIICFSGDAIDNFIKKGINVTVIKKPESLFSHTFIVFTLIKHIRLHKIDIFHSHHRIFDSLSFIIQFFVKVKTITSVQSKVFEKKMLSYKAEILIAVSKTIQNHLIDYYNKPKNRISLINNFVSKNEFSGNINSEWNKEYNPDLSIVLFVGRLNLEKGVDVLLEAYAKVCNSQNNISCYLQIVGDGPFREYCTNFIEKHNLPAATIKPTINIEHYYRYAEMVVLPSRVDPFPLVMLETGLMQKPFIGSNVDGIAELIVNEKNGLLIESNNVESLSEAIIKLLNDKRLSKTLAANLHSEVLENYTSEKVIPQYQRVYRSLLANH